MVMHGYGELVWQWLILNRKPHANWEEGAAGETVVA